MGPEMVIPSGDDTGYIMFDVNIAGEKPEIVHTFGDNEIKIPDWVKTNAGWWYDGQIDDEAFVTSIKYLINSGIMEIPETAQGTSSGGNSIPGWIKNNAGWWADGTLTENEFVNALQYLIKMGIMNVSASAVSDDGASKSQYQDTPKEATKSQSSGNTDLDEMLVQCQGGENKREIRECEKTIKEEY